LRSAPAGETELSLSHIGHADVGRQLIALICAESHLWFAMSLAVTYVLEDAPMRAITTRLPSAGLHA